MLENMKGRKSTSMMIGVPHIKSNHLFYGFMVGHRKFVIGRLPYGIRVPQFNSIKSCRITPEKDGSIPLRQQN